MATIGDFVISDGKISFCEAPYTSSQFYHFIGPAIGCPSIGNNKMQPYRYVDFEYTLRWASNRYSHIITTDDLHILSLAIKDNHQSLKSNSTKDFIKRATEFAILHA